MSTRVTIANKAILYLQNGAVMSECRHFHIQGRVQGVFFRASTRQKAQSLGLTGWVANRPDGSVECLACGDARTLECFREWLWQGPDAARVTQVISTSATDEPPAEFAIR